MSVQQTGDELSIVADDETRRKRRPDEAAQEAEAKDKAARDKRRKEKQKRDEAKERKRQKKLGIVKNGQDGRKAGKNKVHALNVAVHPNLSSGEVTNPNQGRHMGRKTIRLLN